MCSTSLWPRFCSKFGVIVVNDADMNGYQESKNKNQSSVQNAKAHTGTNQKRTNQREIYLTNIQYYFFLYNFYVKKIYRIHLLLLDSTIFEKVRKTPHKKIVFNVCLYPTFQKIVLQSSNNPNT